MTRRIKQCFRGRCLDKGIKGPQFYLCTQVSYVAVKKWNRSILTEINTFCKYIIPIIRKIGFTFDDDYFDEKWE